LIRGSIGVVALLLTFTAIAQDAPAAAASPAFDSAQARLRDADTVASLSAEGAALYEREAIKLRGYQYCSHAVALAERGEFRQSVRAASKALHLGQEGGNEDLVAHAMRDLAIAYSYSGNLELAEQYARDSFKHEAKDPRVIAGPAFKVLGDVAVRRGQLGEAIGHYEKASATSSERFQPLVQISLANVYVAAGKPQEARALYGKITVPREPALRQTYRRGLGNLLLAEGKANEALKYFSEAADAAGGADAAYHRLWAQEGIARAQLALGDNAAARQAYVGAARSVETVRARFRSEEFKVGLFGDVQTIFERAIGMSMDAGDVETAWMLSEQSRSRALLDTVRGRVAALDEASGVRADTALVSLDQVRAVLREDEAIVEFHSLDDRLVAWVIRKGGMTGMVIARPKAALKADVDALRKSIFDRDRAVREHAAALHRVLIAPLQLAPGERLLIVPHGPLHYLPFQALYGEGAYLIERHPVALAPSAGVAVQLAQRGSEAAGELVAFGNPTIEKKYELPGSQREVERISALFAERRVFLQREASKVRFKETASQARVLHVAAHAEVDLVDPLFSRILLAADDRGPGNLEAREIYELDLKNVSLVTISACESGLGRIATGDEILGFTRSFLSAGSSGLIVSLWPVADESTELLMATLYADLVKGADIQVAMQDAQLTVLKRPSFSHPFFWAPFNFIGDWRMKVSG
jgi:CHAT domain-containing protein